MKSQKVTTRQRRHLRVRAKVKGTETKPRLSVFRSLNNNYAQLVDDSKGKVICAASDLKIKKGTKMERAKEVGITLGKLAMEKGIAECVFDRGGFKYHGRIQKIAEGARESGLKF
ncbi:MAG: 50S ribosomal protein L18 [uncultured bacterium]|nr:MAG: 50S ribosomal protein L18 [uncultured bacterium]KKT02471.1 MAG: 50S ribosomal protein L18, large subunit ribosomal protein L18 [Candidatus Peregrinibacteria bacterium GW2011_GWF2_43_17]KKT19299.1 MAG: 50S ribosomal protein L18 [Candidatus Peregrinibacteria bacterium GW2011_GWA2_43_8]HAU40193.1 50S ribosomal protein L18 [Candidatus Peregrinibacteria bacterium]